MTTGHATRTLRRLAHRAAVLTYCGLLVSPVLAGRQAPAVANPSLPAPRPALDPIPSPRLETLEAPVAEQLRAAQHVFLELSARDAVLDAELMEAYGGLGQLYHAYELTEAAEASYLNASRLAPDDHRWQQLLGDLYERDGRLEEAELHFSAAHTLRADYPASAIRLGLVQLQLGKVSEAQASFTSALALAPDPAARAGLGETALAERRFDDAIRHLGAALEQVPEAARLHYPLAMAYRGQGDLDRARQHLKQRGTAGIRPDDPIVDQLTGRHRGERVHLIQGKLAFAAEQFEAAAAAFRAAVDAAPDSARAHVDLGAALAGAGDVDGAIVALETAVRLDDTSLTGHFNLGVLLASVNDHAGAIPHFERFLSERADDLEARRALSSALLAVGRGAEAETYLVEAIEADPGDEISLMGLVQLQVSQGRYADALERLELAEARSPGGERVGNALARMLAGAPDATIRNGPRALEIATRLYTARATVAHGETLALALAEVGRCSEAADLQRRLVAAAERAGQRQMVETLASAVEHYAQDTPCRPAIDATP